MWKRYINQLPLTCPQLGAWPATQICALTRNWTGDLFWFAGQHSIHWTTTARAAFTDQYLSLLEPGSSGPSCYNSSSGPDCYGEGAEDREARYWESSKMWTWTCRTEKPSTGWSCLWSSNSLSLLLPALAPAFVVALFADSRVLPRQRFVERTRHMGL